MPLLYISPDLYSFLGFALYLGLAILVGNFGKTTALGYWGALLISLLVSPLAGFIIVILFRRQRMRKA